MDNFVILPNFDFRSEPIEAESKEDAMAKFAAMMDSDMNQYFVAAPESKVDNYIGAERWRQHVIFVTDWMKSVLMDEDNDFEIEDEETAQDIAKRAFEIYCCGDGYTEYEAVEEAYDEYIAERDEK